MNKKLLFVGAPLVALCVTSGSLAQNDSPGLYCAYGPRFEDGSQVARCLDGTYALDPDGREAGPWGIAHEPGHWYIVEEGGRP